MITPKPEDNAKTVTLQLTEKEAQALLSLLRMRNLSIYTGMIQQLEAAGVTQNYRK
jgi:hypothetical protein